MKYLIVKRAIDVFTSFTAIIILIPFMLPVMVALRLSGEGYVFYFQERIGYRNKKFYIWKFATMLKDSPNMEGGIITTLNDPRITPLGGLLRKTKINELPQLVNVLLGHMSLVGPRPVMEDSFVQYPQEVKDRIYNVRPGITGIGSLVFRNEEELLTRYKESGGNPWFFYKEVIYPYKGQLEAWYQDNLSLWTDLKILLGTFWALLFPQKNISHLLFKDLPPFPDALKLPEKIVNER